MVEIWRIWRKISEFYTNCFADISHTLLSDHSKEKSCTLLWWIGALFMTRIDLSPGNEFVWGMTCSSRKTTNKSASKLPWIISQSTNPSTVYNGKILHFFVRLKLSIRRIGWFIEDHPNFRSRVLSLAVVSSMYMSCSAVQSVSCRNHSWRSSSERSLAILCS